MWCDFTAPAMGKRRKERDYCAELLSDKLTFYAGNGNVHVMWVCAVNRNRCLRSWAVPLCVCENFRKFPEDLLSAITGAVNAELGADKGFRCTELRQRQIVETHLNS